MTEAIALGHDLGHTPFGHAGERALNRACSDGFVHSEQSVRVVEILENNGRGLNLTEEVIDGIRNHRTSGNPSTLEGKVVRLSDKIAYIHHDMDDALRAGIIKSDKVPKRIAAVLGETIAERLDVMVRDVISASRGINDIIMSDDVYSAMMELRSWMFKHVYTDPTAKGQEGKAEDLVETLYYHFFTHFDIIPDEYKMLMERKEKKETVIADYISSMTDRYAINTYHDLFIPIPWMVV